MTPFLAHNPQCLITSKSSTEEPAALFLKTREAESRLTDLYCFPLLQKKIPILKFLFIYEKMCLLITNVPLSTDSLLPPSKEGTANAIIEKNKL